MPEEKYDTTPDHPAYDEALARERAAEIDKLIDETKSNRICPSRLVSQPNAVTLSLKPERATELFGSGLRSCSGLRQALLAGKYTDAGYYFGWLDAVLTEVAAACPKEIKEGAHLTIRSGGGQKPDPSK